MNGLSLFSSAGIAETYFSAHKIFIKVASELLPERAKIYSHLYPDANVHIGDITNDEIFNSVILDAKENDCKFLIATPPCQGMSSAGKQQKDDIRNRLIIRVIDAIKALEPDFVIIENVPEILTTKILIDDVWVLINDYIENEIGAVYNINKNKVVNAMHYGTAQSRERCIYLLSKKGSEISWEFPEKFDHILTMRDVIGDLPSLDPDVTDLAEEERLRLFPNYYEKKAQGLAVSKWHYPPKHKIRHVIAMMHTPEGHSAWENLKYYPTLKDGTKSKGYKNTYKRQWWDRPAYTITKFTSRLGSQENGHPGYPIVNSKNEEKRIWSDARTMTIFELMRLTGLPDNWNIPANTSTNVIREILGEGVPPRLLEVALIQIEHLHD